MRPQDGGSVLVFDFDAAGLDQAAAGSRRCGVRLVGVDRRAAPDHADPPSGGLSAVLVLRALTPARLMSCVRALNDGSSPVAPELLCQMLGGAGAPVDDGPLGKLTQREFAVLRLLADGASTRDIAERMSYSERTVKNIVHDLLAKLNCRTRAHAVAFAVRHGVI
jgi:DNA-binding CsgD family transcriptional regulator